METLIIILFIAGYACIAFEHSLKINKAASALLTGVLCWTIYILFQAEPAGKGMVESNLHHHLGELAGILFFLMGAMTIVELIDAHDGFEVITSRIKTRKKSRLLWIVSLLSFFLSAVLDNLTTTIVMISLIRKLVPEQKQRLFFAGMIVIAANAGGAWSPIGDVTTTMLWIGGQLSTGAIISKLIFPSMLCLLAPLIVTSLRMKGEFAALDNRREDPSGSPTTPFERNFVFYFGIAMLLFVPVFKTVTHLPPYMGILFGLGLLWIVTEIIHYQKDDEDKGAYSVLHALRKIDMPSILFFLGILLAVSALQSTGLLSELATWMNDTIGNLNIIVTSIGLLSAIIDNVPLVAASMGMYDIGMYPMDHYLWEFLAYCAGTGGSILIIGSAAGVAAMGMEKIDFFWYLKNIGWLAALGYFAGVGAYILQHALFPTVL
ncbi:MAG: sodium:proton antiporter NhaD [Bacteroidia bacterium]|nr:sodium:proton antiporter NhaD [Bacteroidia bacterium]